MTMAKDFDVVELTRPVGDWPAGISGTVLEVHPDGALMIEADASGREGIDAILDAPADAVRVLEAAG